MEALEPGSLGGVGGGGVQEAVGVHQTGLVVQKPQGVCRLTPNLAGNKVRLLFSTFSLLDLADGQD